MLFIQKIKPFTTKAPVVIEALDVVAEEFGMSRNAFVLKNFLEVYLGSAYVDYQNGYGVPFNEDPHVFPVSQLES